MDALDHMRRAAIFVQPSFFEGLPLALQEAMLLGCACVGTDIPGNKELIVQGQNGLLVPKGDVAELAQALRRLMDDAELRDRFAARGRESLLQKGMTVQRMAQKHRQLYRELLASES
jgi:glycosyltransferase involved in cell wall biosynthesis